jgi:bifunctional non-homologous end joining protein LigD
MKKPPATERGLDAYRRKRTAGATPEPMGTGVSRPRLFVVQQHAARRLHHDFRLEWGDVLLSWAVPRGPSLDPSVKRLAVHVEDHPVEYADFEGLIPEGNYGAGAVILWDRGRWIPLEDVDEGLRRGKLLFELEGYKLRGAFTLVRTAGKARADSKEWLLIKKPDVYAVSGETEDEARLPPESVLSGLTLEELREGPKRLRRIRRRLRKLGAAKAPVSARGTRPMLAERSAKPFSRQGWVFEVKYDGYRCIAE